MLKEFRCPDGTVYASCKQEGGIITVDEVIAFLEQHRGKQFWNGAAENTSFRTDGEMVSCDSLTYWMEELEDEELSERIQDFFDGD